MAHETLAPKLRTPMERAFGHRARLGYASVAFVTEVLPAAFYRMAPEGVSLAFLTVQREGGRGGNHEELDRIFDDVVAAGRSLARAGVDLVIPGGRPVILRRGLEGADGLLKELSHEFGVPAISDATAQARAYRALGSKRIATAHPFGEEENPRHEAMIAELGFEPAGASATARRASSCRSSPPRRRWRWAARC